MAPVRTRHPAHDEVAETLRREILGGVYAPGAALRQDHLARQFRCSHIPVREALRRIVAEGLAVEVRNRGVSVAPLDPAEARELTELRVLLEGQALDLALPKLDGRSFERAGDILTRLDGTRGLDDMLALDGDFHATLYGPAERPRLLAMIEQQRGAFERYVRHIWSTTPSRRESAGRHWQLLKLCRDGEAAAARAHLSDHIERTGRVIVRALEAH